MRYATNGQTLPLHLGPEDDSPRPALVLRSAEFRKGREPGWLQLERIVGKVETQGIHALTCAEAQELPLLYRSAMSSLSVARNTVLDRNMLLFLESLALRAYLVVYGPRSGVMENLWGFLTAGFPRAVRAIRPYLAMAVVLLMAGVIAGWVLVSRDMSLYTTLIPEELAQGRVPGTSREELAGHLFSPWPGFTETFIVFANSLFRHNTIVGILCFSLGFALGVPTVLLLLYNGLILGAFIALHGELGLTLEVIGWLSIHGVTEILAILLCAAAGLAVAGTIVFPGPYSRLDNLARHGKQAAAVAAGAALLFFLAGIFEGGFRQLINNTPGRFAFALASAAVWTAYFSLGGRNHGPAD